MRAIVYNHDGSADVFRCEEIEKPTPADDEVLLRVRAASLNPLDSHLSKHPLMRRMVLGVSKLKVNRPGRDVAGEVEAVGSNVTQFKPGDAVFGWCGGAFAEFACTPQSALFMKPPNVSFEQAAAVPVAGLTALQALRDTGKVQAGEKVLINGAAGGVGTFAVQIAKSFGAEVTGVCSAKNVELVRSIGADRIIDYTREDFTTGGQRYDIIFDLVANHSFKARRRVLDSKGIYIMAGMVGLDGTVLGLLKRLLGDLLLSRFASQKFVMFMAKLRQDDLAVLSRLMESGKVTSVIDRSYALSEVPEAVRYLEERHARGKVIITV